MNTVVFKISEGNITFLVSDHTKALVNQDAVVRRASHIEPMSLTLRFAFRLLRKAFGDEGKAAEFTREWPCLWRADLTPVGGPVVYNFSSRETAIDFEIQWLNKFFLAV